MSRDAPRCPECDEPVSETASYCLHCDAGLDDGDETSVEAAVVDFGEPAAGDGSPADGTRRTAADVRGGPSAGPRFPDVGGGSEAPTDHQPDQATDGERGGTDPAPDGADDGGWFHPDSLLDDVSTGFVGVVSGLVFGFLAMIPLLAWTDSAIGFLVWPVGLVGAGLYVGWTRSVFGAVRKACYLLAPTLAALPLFWFAPAVEVESFGGRFLLFAVSEAVVLPVAAVLAGLGYRLAKEVPDAEGQRTGNGGPARAETAADAADSRGATGDDDRGWFHPDSLLDDVSTGLVGIVAGLVVGTLAMVLAWIVTASPWAFLVGPVGWIGVGLAVGWTRSAFGAVRKACYALAPTLAALPLIWFGEAMEGGDLGGAVFAVVVSEAVVLPIALAVVGLGYWTGGKAPRE